MALHAFDDVDDAVDATKNLLLPFGVRKWFYYAIVAIFVGGGATFPTSFGQSFTTSPDPSPTPGGTPPGPGEIPDVVLLAIVALVAVGILLGLAFAVLSSILQFVFFDALRTKDLEIRAGIRRYLGKGLRLLGFNLALAFVALVPVLALVVVAVGFAIAFPPLLLVGLLAIPLFIVYYLALGIVGSFTSMFVVPLMLAEDRGVLSAWGRLWPAVRSNLKEFGAYVLMAFVLNLAIGFISGIAALVVGIVLAVPFGVVFGGLFVLLGGPSSFAGAFALTPGLVVGILGLLLFGLAFLLAMGYVQAPLQAFVRYYAAFVLGDVDPDLDPIEDVRREVRADGGGETGAESAREDDEGADTGSFDDFDGGPDEFDER